MRDSTASAFERRFLAWLHIHFGVEPVERAGTNAFYWSFPFNNSDVTFVIVGRSMNGAPPTDQGTDWLLRVEEAEGAGFVSYVEPYFRDGSGVKRRMAAGRVRTQFTSANLLRQFEDQAVGTGLPRERVRPAPRRADAGAPVERAIHADLQMLMQSQLPVLRSRHLSGNGRPCAAYINKDGYIFDDAIDSEADPERAINQMACKLRQGLRDGRVIAGAVFFHSNAQGESPLVGDPVGHNVIAGHFEHHTGEGVKMIWPYAPEDEANLAPGRVRYEAPTLVASGGLPVMYVVDGRWSRTPAEGPGGPIRHIAIDEAGHIGVVTCGEGAAFLYEMKTAERIGPFPVHIGSGTAHALDPWYMRVLQGEMDGQLNLHALTRPRTIPLARAATGAVTTCALSADGSRALAGTVGGELICCDLHFMTARTLRLQDPHPIDACAIAPDGGTALTITANGVLTIWHLEYDMPVALSIHESSLTDARHAAVSGNRRYALVQGSRLFVVWDLAAQRPGALTDVGAPISACAISPNGQFVVLGLASGVLRVWDVVRGRPGRADLDTSDVVTAITFSNDGSSLFIGNASGAVEYLQLMPT